MSRLQSRGFLANVSANLVVGAASLGYSVIVPALVVRRFGAEVYGNWYLAFQLASYIVLLDLGSQYLVTTEAARPSPDGGGARVTTAAMLVQSALAVMLLAVATAWADLTGQARLAQVMIVLGIAATASLLASTVRAWFAGLRQAHVPAAWLVSARVASLVGLVVAAVADASLLALTIAVAAPQLVIHLGLLLWARRPPSPWARPDRAAFTELVRRTLPLAVWTVCGVFISGVDIFVVRGVDPSEVARYAVALPLLAVPTGVVTALTTAWIPRVARAHESPVGARSVTAGGTTMMAVLLALGALAFVGYADVLVNVLAGPGRWAAAATYLRILYLASCLRFVLLPWAVLTVVRAEQGAIVLMPLVEASTNLVVSVLLGLWVGAVGVALGTLVGAGGAVVVCLTWGVRRTSRSGVTAGTLIAAVTQARLPVAVSAAAATLAVMLADRPVFWRSSTTVAALAVNAWWVTSHRTAATAVRQPEHEAA